MQIEIKKADFLAVEVDGILVPTISDGQMVEPIAALVKEQAGEEVEEEIMRSAPIAVGAAVVTGSGRLHFKHLIHVPVTEQPGMKIGVENIRRATRAGLLASTHFEMAQVAIPGFGYGEIGVPFDEAARAIIDEVRAYRGTFPEKVYLMDLNEEMISAFKQELGSK